MKRRKNKKKILLTTLFIIIIVVALFLLLTLLPKKIINNIAIIQISGTIGGTSSILTGDAISSDEVIKYLEKAESDPTVKGIILEINSPGGTVVSSKEIAEKVKSIDKPVVAWIREVGASGAYWIASASDSIVADPMSITGSIGVISGFLEFSQLFENHGITYEEFKGGEYKNMGSPFKELNEKERIVMQGKIDIIHKYFTKVVMENRNLESADFANGLFYLGIEAKALGLVDYLGGKKLAINITKDLAGIDQASIIRFEREKTLLEKLSRLSQNSFFMMGRGISSGVVEQNSLAPVA